MALGTENSPRFFGGGNSGIKFLHRVIENLLTVTLTICSQGWDPMRGNRYRCARNRRSSGNIGKNTLEIGHDFRCNITVVEARPNLAYCLCNPLPGGSSFALSTCTLQIRRYLPFEFDHKIGKQVVSIPFIRRGQGVVADDGAPAEWRLLKIIRGLTQFAINSAIATRPIVPGSTP